MVENKCVICGKRTKDHSIDDLDFCCDAISYRLRRLNN